MSRCSQNPSDWQSTARPTEPFWSVGLARRPQQWMIITSRKLTEASAKWAATECSDPSYRLQGIEMNSQATSVSLWFSSDLVIGRFQSIASLRSSAQNRFTVQKLRVEFGDFFFLRQSRRGLLLEMPGELSSALIDLVPQADVDVMAQQRD